MNRDAILWWSVPAAVSFAGLLFVISGVIWQRLSLILAGACLFLSPLGLNRLEVRDD